MKLNKIFLLAGVVVIASAIIVYFCFFDNEKSQKTQATATSQTVTSQASWQGGDNSALLDTTTSVGSIKINVSGGITQVDTSGASFSADTDAGNASKIMDGNDATGWGFGSNLEGECHWVKVDLGSIVTGISRLSNVGGGDADSSQEVSFSEDDSSYTAIYQFGGGMGVPIIYDLPVAKNARYIKINACNEYLFGGPADPVGENELKVYQGPFLATNKETIDGGANLWDWETFTPTQTVPANTSVTYRYRSSANGSDWNAWYSSFGDVESRSGDTRYRYLQIEATLSNTDGISTPTIDSYSIDYHTEAKPSAPTAQTAVVR